MARCATTVCDTRRGRYKNTGLFTTELINSENLKNTCMIAKQWHVHVRLVDVLLTNL